MNAHLSSLPRRDFLKAGAASLAAVVTGGPSLFASALQAAGPLAARKSIGIQVGAVSFVDEGTDKVIDLLQERGAIDTIYLTRSLMGEDWLEDRFPDIRFPTTARRNPTRRRFTGAITPLRTRSSIATRC